jgi:hypothetical protein
MDDLKHLVHLTLKSNNAKTGPIPVSTTSEDTCPPTCPFYRDSCYAHLGPLGLHWGKVTRGERGHTWSKFCARIASLPAGQLWRHNQAGDLPGDGLSINAEALDQLVEANADKRGFTYTHYPLTGESETEAHNRDAVRRANEAGFTINLSGNNLAHADHLASLDIAPVTTVLPSDTDDNTYTPAGRKVVVCPATQRDDVSCATCQLCQRSRDVIVGFPAHGPRKRRASAVAETT